MKEKSGGMTFFNAIVLHYQAGEVAFETLCAVGVLCERARIRSPKCKSSRGVNHVALRLKTVGVINHLGMGRRIFSAFHRVAVYITLRHFFYYYFYLPCENQYFNAIHRIFTCNCLRAIFAVFLGLFTKNRDFYNFSIILLHFIFHFILSISRYL